MGTPNPDKEGGDPLDGRWVLDVGGRIYGPYTGHALKEYVAEGRVAAHSVVARTGRPAGEEVWMPAADDPALGRLFMDDAIDDMPAEAAPVRHDAPNPSPQPDPRADERHVTYGSRKGQVDRRKQPGSFNLVIVTDIKSRSSGPVEDTILSLGPAFKLSANAWVVHTPSGAPEVVNVLTRHLGSADRLFVVDATRNRTAWFNMGPETDAKIRQVWKHEK